MAYNTPNSLVISSSAVISGTAVSSTIVYPGDNGTFIPLMVAFTGITMSGLTLLPTVSLGTTAGGTDIMGTTLLTGLNAVNKVLNMILTTSKAIANMPIYCNVAVVGVGTTYNFRCTIVGTYLN